MINNITPPQQTDSSKQLVLTLPTGNNGLHFSTTVPCEICRVDLSSPIFESAVQFIGRIAFHVEIPNKIDICGALDHITLAMILMKYTNVPNRKLIFLKRGEGLLRYITTGGSVITTTILPMGPINATFRSTRNVFPSRNRVFVAQPGPKMLFLYPVDHYVAKVIIPNIAVFDGGMRSPNRLLHILDHFAKVPGREIVFQNQVPKRSVGLTTEVILPKGHTGITFDLGLKNSDLPVISTVPVGSSAWRLNIQTKHVVEKLIIPNEVTVDRIDTEVVRSLLANFSEIEGRVMVLRELHRDIPRAGASVTMTLPTGKLGAVFKSLNSGIWVAEVEKDSPVQRKCPVGYYVESLIVPGQLELIGNDELQNVTFLTKKLKESAHIPHRIMVLRRKNEEVRIRVLGSRFAHEIV